MLRPLRSTAAATAGSTLRQRLSGTTRPTDFYDVKLFKHHVGVITTHQPCAFPKRPELEPESPLAAYSQYFKALKADDAVKVSYMFDVHNKAKDAADGAQGQQLLVFPQGKIVSGITDSMQARQVCAAICHDRDVATVAGVKVTPLTGLHFVVCCHEQRDCNCKVGNQLRQWLEAAAQVSDTLQVPLYVWPSSHLGGHKHAGIAIVYPGGHHHGALTTQEQCQHLIDFHAVERTAQEVAAECDTWRATASVSAEENRRLAKEYADRSSIVSDVVGDILIATTL